MPEINCKLSTPILRKLDLAHRLAYQHAKEVIESECVLSISELGRWFNLDDCICDSDQDIADAVEYLELMGMLDRHSEHRNLVQVKIPQPRAVPATPVGKHGIASRFDRQQAIACWCAAAFGFAAATSLPQRGIRLLEEACEAAQAAGVNTEMAHKLVDYVWSRPVGELKQEIGGVGVTLLALAAAVRTSADECEAAEVMRVLAKPIDYFKQRNAVKNAAGFDATVAAEVS